MIRKLVLAAAIGAAALSPAAFAEDPAFNTSTTVMSAVWENEEAKAAFTKVFPEIAANPQLQDGMSLTISEISGYAPDIMTPEKLKELQAEFDKIGAE